LARLVVVSNRVALPGDRGRAGGLAVALREALKRAGGLWFGWSGEIVEAASEAPAIVTEGRTLYATLDLNRQDYEDFYVGYANSCLWPVVHYMLGRLAYRRNSLAGYLRVNQRFAQALHALLRPDDTVWIHDYHFIPFAAELRRLGFGGRIGFFLHTPFPTTEVVTALPGHDIVLPTLAAYDLVGVQTERDLNALLDYATHEPALANALYGGRLRARAFPIGLDVEPMVRAAVQAGRAVETQRLRQSLVGRQLIIGVDRLDYSKGIDNRFNAFRELIESNEAMRGRTVLMQIAPPSRSDVGEYRTLRRELERIAGSINGRYAEPDWVPVRYLNRSFTRQTLAGFFRVARAGLVTPLRDGMNLVAKEYVASQDPEDPGVLILSRFAGAAAELDAALIVNPFDVERMGRAMAHALDMPLDERRDRWQRMMTTIRGNSIGAWRDRFLSALAETEGHPPATS